MNNELAKQIENGDFTLQHSPATGFKTSDPYRFEGEEVETKIVGAIIHLSTTIDQVDVAQKVK